MKRRTNGRPKTGAKKASKARDLMTRDVASCGPEDALAEAARIMWDRDCGIVPVVDPEQRLLGVVTDRDLCMAAFHTDGRLSGLPVRTAMAADPVACRDTDSRTAIHAAMRERQVRRLPVVDADGRLVGILSLNDLVRDAASGRGATGARRSRDLVATLGEIGRRRETAGIASA